MAPKFHLRRALLSAGCAFAAAALAIAGGAMAQGDRPPGGDRAQVQVYQYSTRQALTDSEATTLGQVLAAARLGDAPRIRNLMGQFSNPLARKIALWALIEANPDGMSYAELDGARRDLAGWPGATKRLAATEKAIENGGLRPQAVVDWFAGADPLTPEGAMALASAYQATGDSQHAAQVIRHIWRAKPFDSGAQQAMMSRFSQFLSADDYAAREDMLLYGVQGDASRALLPYLSADQRALAQARMALRQGSGGDAAIAALPPSLRDAPGLGYEQALAAQRRGDNNGALAMVPRLPNALPDTDSQSRMWKLRKQLVVAALRAGDTRGAYRAAAYTGIDQGADGAEAEFYAGWLALSRMHDPKLADEHFKRLQAIGQSPITASRALYWRGRAAEAMGDAVDAQLFYADGARYITAFYGQLAAAKAGITTLSIGRDPEITAADRSRFEDREPIRAARMMAEIGAKDTFKSFVMGIAETLPSAQEAAQLVDLTRNLGDQELSMKVVRKAAQHGLILPERGYPMRTPPSVAGGAETAFVLGITRQESGFDPHARSGAGATGMMQLMPATAHTLAHKLGYGPGALEDATYNMTLGSAFLGQLVDRFDGSYIMAAAAYNAGPGRPTEWAGFCGDPRTSSADPADFIECIPFGETRDYVMRVMEATEVYRARLAGGSAKLMIAPDLKRGGFGYSAGPALTSAMPPIGARSAAASPQE
ncbi:MAG TPA: lytic transglycosylase domain-containing protein [Caulobacteraceae bacterium]|nr:lytic transglycosylase domain-containing protein [Caulobacteraceae bacterium]